MAAPITTTATTLEAQLVEVASAMVEAELAIAVETRPDNISITPDIENGLITITANLPAAFSAGAAGQIELNATAYLGV